MIEILHKINDACNGDVIFTGSVSEVFQGIKDKSNDIDIILKDATPFKYCYKFSQHPSKSAYSKSGIRAVFYLHEKLIDAFIEQEFPEFVVIDGLKFETIESMYKWSLQTVGRTWSIYYKKKLRDRVFRLENVLKQKNKEKEYQYK